MGRVASSEHNLGQGGVSVAGEVIRGGFGGGRVCGELEEEEVTEQGIKVPGVEHTGSSVHALHTVDRTGL